MSGPFRSAARSRRVPAMKTRARMKIALVDFDANVNFLDSLERLANKSQSYFYFQLEYLAYPRAAILPKYYHPRKEPVDRFIVAEVEDYLSRAPDALKVDLVCAFTAALINDEEYDDLFSTSLTSNSDVYLISTFDLRDYARKSGCSYAKAVFWQCISVILTNHGLPTHAKTAGCPLDFCDNREDLMDGLRKMRFDHKPCRSKVKDDDMLAAIDRLLELELPDNQAGTGRGFTPSAPDQI
jgi:hypothetical protein